ncbi:hypothetical protein CF15_01865 [Pyrodictium occultum]|uniref:NurA domain-containing protein n=1 Tax=Pyrodictium occultum TaxID=2309 RepID=A0A0V8RUE0_PYROC|nr:DNA double-strand break repair nuclease NurA [Pyrodictium occultum]KSW11602.1 hypothetical protein CF15_01865 [Pyrodictium occultum]
MPRLAGDWFVDLFTSEAEKLIESIRLRGGGRQLEGLPSYWWVPGLPEPAGNRRVAAVDGGGGLEPAGGAGALYIARAYGYVEAGEPERGLELRYYPVRESRVLDALRSWLEHRIAVRLALRLPPGSVLLMDGSLWVTVTAGLTALAKLASHGAQSLGLVYTALLSGYMLAEIAGLVRAARERGVTVAYVSKDHGFRALKEKVLLEAVAERVRALQPLASRALDYYPLAFREQLLEARRLVPHELRGAFDAALDMSYRDSFFIADAAGQGPGYSWVLRMPPPLRLSRALARGGIKGLVERAASRAEALLAGEPEAEEFRSLAERLPGLLDELPCSRMIYVRLGAGDAPLLAEFPGEPGCYYSPGRVLEEPGAREEELVAVLRAGYAGPEYYNVQLVAAHMNATLTSSQLAGYIRLLEQLAAARGLQLRLARRSIMGRTLARRRRRLV